MPRKQRRPPPDRWTNKCNKANRPVHIKAGRGFGCAKPCPPGYYAAGWACKPIAAGATSTKSESDQLVDRLNGASTEAEFHAEATKEFNRVFDLVNAMPNVKNDRKSPVVSAEYARKANERLLANPDPANFPMNATIYARLDPEKRAMMDKVIEDYVEGQLGVRPTDEASEKTFKANRPQTRIFRVDGGLIIGGGVSSDTTAERSAMSQYDKIADKMRMYLRHGGRDALTDEVVDPNTTTIDHFLPGSTLKWDKKTNRFEQDAVKTPEVLRGSDLESYGINQSYSGQGRDNISFVVKEGTGKKAISHAVIDVTGADNVNNRSYVSSNFNMYKGASSSAEAAIKMHWMQSVDSPRTVELDGKQFKYGQFKVGSDQHIYTPEEHKEITKQRRIALQHGTYDYLTRGQEHDPDILIRSSQGGRPVSESYAKGFERMTNDQIDQYFYGKSQNIENVSKSGLFVDDSKTKRSLRESSHDDWDDDAISGGQAHLYNTHIGRQVDDATGTTMQDAAKNGYTDVISRIEAKKSYPIEYDAYEVDMKAPVNKRSIRKVKRKIEVTNAEDFPFIARSFTNTAESKKRLKDIHQMGKDYMTENIHHLHGKRIEDISTLDPPMHAKIVAARKETERTGDESHHRNAIFEAIETISGGPLGSWRTVQGEVNGMRYWEGKPETDVLKKSGKTMHQEHYAAALMQYRNIGTGRGFQQGGVPLSNDLINRQPNTEQQRIWEDYNAQKSAFNNALNADIQNIGIKKVVEKLAK